jgi:hypothetical protein
MRTLWLIRLSSTISTSNARLGATGVETLGASTTGRAGATGGRPTLMKKRKAIVTTGQTKGDELVGLHNRRVLEKREGKSERKERTTSFAFFACNFNRSIHQLRDRPRDVET